jgi:hypothetical protein
MAQPDAAAGPAAAAASARADDDAVREALSEMAMAFDYDAEEHMFSAGFKLPPALAFAEGFRLYVSATGGLVAALATSAYRVPEAARPHAARALLHLTGASTQGSFELDLADGEVRYRVAWPRVPGARLPLVVKSAVRLACGFFPLGTAALVEQLKRKDEAADDERLVKWAMGVAEAMSQEISS